MSGNPKNSENLPMDERLYLARLSEATALDVLRVRRY